MDTSADVMVLAQPAAASASSASEEDGAEAETAASPPPTPGSLVHLEEFSSRLSDIIGAHGNAGVQNLEMENQQGAPGDLAVAMETETSQIKESLDRFPSPQDKLEELVQRHAELVVVRRRDQQQIFVLQAETRRGAATLSKLETLCKDVQTHSRRLWEETVQRCREDEERRTEMASHFQAKLTDIQAQIEQHSARNDKLCRENANLTDKLELLVNQCEVRDESLEKINRHHELQLKLSEAKLQQADALLTEAQEKHKREKEYLLREAIEKTKKCCAMKEQELSMKKKLTLYAQKFDEFQGTLAKSNEIYARFKAEMDQMTEKMKKMEKETNLWKSRFENCNKALTDMMEERTEKGKEFDLFVLKIQKLEKLCRVLQEERVVLYEKIKDVRKANTDAHAKVLGSAEPDQSALLTPTEIQEIQEEDPVLTEDMSRLREEQTKLQEFAASLFSTPAHEEEREETLDLEEDEVSSAFMQFKTRTQTRTDSVPEKVENPPEEGKGLDDKAATQQPPVEPEPASDPSADMKPEAGPEVSIQNSDPVQVPEAAEPREGNVTVAPPTDTSAKKQTSKKKKKRNTKNVS
ncbi:beta-taxilin isoform X1 [Takifugu flavidus]|uniref:beta-taxilin isoform X1 n=1 Tax=Takifugu flavidus TaxID=433684 RepID=UPI002543FE0B|nr:beta-taxilin isoform X1 [Takifugu flavidus]